MSKKGIFFLMSLSCLSLCLSSSYAQNTESITISTYYPSPYGNYHEMRAQRVAIGDNYIFGDQYCWAPEACITTIAPDADLVVEGNVGIGTVTPVGALQVKGYNSSFTDPTGSSNMTLVKIQGYDDNASLNLGFDTNASTIGAHQDIYMNIDNLNKGTNHAFVWGTDRMGITGGSELMRLTQTGNVGIGTTTPAELLHLSQSPSASLGRVGVRLTNTATGGRDYAMVSTDNNNGIGGGRLGFYDFTAGTFRAVIDSSGNVGIGTTNPQRSLHIANITPTVGANIRLENTAVGGSSWEMGENLGGGAPKSFTIYNLIDNMLAFMSRTGYSGSSFPAVGIGGAVTVGACAYGTDSTERFRVINPTSGQAIFKIIDNNGISIIDAAGNVGIGTIDPGAYRLNVNGAIYTSGGCTGCSDARWKTNIMPISATLDKIMALTGVQFNWRTKEYPRMFFQEGLDYGLVAQDVEKTLQEIVYEDNGYKYIRYDRLSAILIEATKEQQEEINQLKQELAQQKAELANLKEKM